MADENTGASDLGNQPELVEFTLNGQTVTGTPAQKVILSQLEHDYKSGMNKKMEEANEKLKETKNVAALMAEDATWFNTHEPSLYGQYEMLANGGRGFLGDETQVNPAMSGNNYSPDTEVKLAAEVETLKSQVKSLTDTVQAGRVKGNETDKVGAVVAAEELCLVAGIALNSPAYKMVFKQMESYYHTNNQSHPRKHEISPMVDAVKELMGKGIEKAGTKLTKTTPTTPTTPTVSGGVPPPPKPKELDFSGPNGLERFKQDIANTLQGQAQ